MSRYKRLTPIIKNNEGQSIRPGLQFADFYFDGEVKYHQVLENERGALDLIAYQWYKDCSLYWVIAIFNNIIDPLSVKPGDILAIPQGPISTKNIQPFTYPGVN